MSSKTTIKFADRTVPLSQCAAGTVIAQRNISGEPDPSKYVYSHLIGFSRNSYNELILVLQRFADSIDGGYDESQKKIEYIHPGNCFIEEY